MDVITYILLVVYFFSFFFVVFWLINFIVEPEQKKVGKMKKFPKVSVAVPAYNEEKHIQKTIRSLINLDYPKNKIEIIVINDGSTDKTQNKTEAMIKKYPKSKIILINQKNSGKGAALNKAIAKAKGDFFVCLDADSYPQKNALLKILPHFEKRTDIAAVLPCMKTCKGHNILQKAQRYEYIVNMFYKELMAKLDCIRVTPGPFSVYRKSVLDKIGGFDENNLTEDLEMALRLQKYNYKIMQTMETNVFTVPPSNLKGLIQQRNRWYKGSVLNTLKYKNMMFRKKFGDFGMMQMPITLISGILTLTIIFTALYFLIKPIIEKINQLTIIGFDLSSMLVGIQKWFTNFSLLDLNYILISLSIMMTVTTLYVLKKSHVNTKEKVLKQGLLPLAFYTILYFFILGIVWINIGFDFMIKRQQKW